jgi:ABC-type microcin C transport system duplicated ATPase subunit YejF
MSLLDVNGLRIRYGESEVVSGLSFTLESGESLGLVGESGSGKTQTALAILGLLPKTASIEGSIAFDDTEVVGASTRTLNRLRAERVGIVFQDPMQALNPYVPIGAQLRRILIGHGLADGREADQRVMHMLDRVGLPDPGRQFRAYAHQLSGGMRQRVMIASALIAQPTLLIADEPTTALDVTVQAQILELLERLRDDTALLLITHDLAIVAGHCERMVVLQQGRLIEEGPTRRLFSAPAAAGTRALIHAAPRFEGVASPPPQGGNVLLDVQDLSVSYRERAGGGELSRVRESRPSREPCSGSYRCEPVASRSVAANFPGSCRHGQSRHGVTSNWFSRTRPVPSIRNCASGASSRNR